MNRWRIPDTLERRVRDRDRACIYCHVPFDRPDPPRGQRTSWEHIVNDARIVTEANIALCCISCNASKGAKPLADWLQSAYCKRKGIEAHRLAPVARAALNATLPAD